jgi:hypothetical protein
MKIGKLYQVKKYYWLLYPSKDIADAFLFASLDTAAAAAAYYSKEYNCNVSYLNPNSIFCFLEQNEKFIKILSTNGELGWIYLSDFYKNYIEEVNQ